MKHVIITICLSAFSLLAVAQENVYPAKPQTGVLIVKGGTVHVGNGQVLQQATIKIENGKITEVGNAVTIPAGAKVVDATGKHVYPGLILANSQLGLVEVNSVRATQDATEIGTVNPSIRSIVAYNTDSKVINTLKANGILLANVVPQGALVSGTSSVVQLDAWNREDAAYELDGGMHFDMPSLILRSRRFGVGGDGKGASDVVKEALDQIEAVKDFFRQAKSYLAEAKHEKVNLKFEAAQHLFSKKQKLFVHCNLVKEMLIAIDFIKEFGFDVVIVGGSESWQIPDLLQQNKIAVILSQQHSLPTTPDDDVDQPYKTAAVLQKAGVLVALNDEDGQTRGRNLPFNAGTAAAYGMGKEEALSAITLNTAKILGIDKKTGSIEVGKDANIVISEGDILDMRTSIITFALIQGREVSLETKHTQLNERYLQKYGVK
jgi:imidazolonepropionase-like amidohydrolase